MPKHPGNQERPKNSIDDRISRDQFMCVIPLFKNFEMSITDRLCDRTDFSLAIMHANQIQHCYLFCSGEDWISEGRVLVEARLELKFQLFDQCTPHNFVPCSMKNTDCPRPIDQRKHRRALTKIFLTAVARLASVGI